MWANNGLKFFDQFGDCILTIELWAYDSYECLINTVYIILIRTESGSLFSALLIFLVNHIVYKR